MTPISYGPGFVERARALAPGGVDAAIDAVGIDQAIDASLELVSNKARIATLVAFEKGAAVGIRTLGAVGGATDPGDDVRSAAWAQLVPLAADRKLDVPVSRTFPLTEVVAAHELISSGHADGKIVLLP